MDVDSIITEIVGEFDSSLTLKPKQLDCLRCLLSNDRCDVIASLPVGYGKSLIYQLFSRLKVMKLKVINCQTNVQRLITLVITPLNIIQREQITYLQEHGVSACKIPLLTGNEGDNEAEDSESDSVTLLDDIKIGLYEVVFCHPEALLNTPTGSGLLNSHQFVDKVELVVIDECHIVETWGAEFRTAYQKLKTLPAVFEQQPFLALSGTITVAQMKSLPVTLGFDRPIIVKESPDRPNIFLRKVCKIKGQDVSQVYENLYIGECDQLKKDPDNYPITLMFMPLFYISQAAAYLQHIFGPSDIRTSHYAVLFSNQDKDVIQTTVTDLKTEKPRIRLVLTSSVSGMGFDPPTVVRVIHAKPPRSLAQYLQEIGRAGRRGQNANALLYFNRRDIAANLPGIQPDIIEYCKNNDRCLREMLLEPFGFSPSENVEKGHCCSFCVDKMLSDTLDTVV